MSNRSIPRRLGDSRQYRRLVTQLAYCVAERIWRRGVVQRWESEDELVVYLQEVGLFLGARMAEWPGVFAEFTAAGFLVDEGEAIVLPILTADTLRVMPTPQASPEAQAAAEKQLREKALSMHVLRLSRKGDARAILARNEDGTPEERASRAEAAAAAWAAIEAEYNHAERRRIERRRGGDRRGPVTDRHGAPVTDDHGPAVAAATAPATGPVPVPPASEFSFSPGSAASTAEPEREGEFRSAREGGPVARSVTEPAVTTAAPVTAPAPAGPLSADQLRAEAPADVGQFFLDVMVSRAPGDFPKRADPVDAANLGRVIVARGASETDLRMIGGRWKHDPAAARALLGWALKPTEKIPVSLLLGAKVDGAYEGAMFGRLLSDARGWVDELAARRESVKVPTDPPFRRVHGARPGVVPVADAPPAQRGTGSGPG